MVDGFSRIAMSVDLSLEQATGVPAVGNVHPTFTQLPVLEAQPDATAPPVIPRTNQQTLDYIRSVARRVDEVRATAVPEVQ